MKTKLALLLILVAALWVRVWRLGELPFGMFGDEVDVGYHSWALWTTGRDYSGQILPSYIRSLSEYRAPLLMYVSAPFVGLLGPSDFSTRLATALLGVLCVWLIYLVGLRLFAGSKTASSLGALVAAGVMALSPWAVHYSRTAFEVSLLVSLWLLGLVIYFYVDSKQKTVWFLVPMVLCLYTYSTANIFIPLSILGLVVYDRTLLGFDRGKLLGFLVAICLTLPMLLNMASGKAGARFGLISIFSNQKLVDEVIVSRTRPWAGENEEWFNNKYVRVAREFVGNYLDAWSGRFLFFEGDGEPRHQVGGFGGFSLVWLPLLILGLVRVVSGGDKRLILLGWFCLSAPLASALTVGGGNHATRLFVMVPVLALVIGLGMTMVPARFRGVCVVILLMLSSVTLGSWWRQMAVHHVNESQNSWQYGYKELFEEFARIDDGKGQVYINNTREPVLIRFAFYTRVKPGEFIENFKTDKMMKTELGIGYEFADRYVFGKVGLESLPLLKKGDYYLAAQGEEIPGDMDLSKTPLKGFDTLYKISDAYGLPRFYILRKNEDRP